MKHRLLCLCAATCILAAFTSHKATAVCAVHQGVDPEDRDLVVELDANRLDPGNYLTGDWGGFRSTLHERGIDISLSYTTEPAGNPSGGREQGFTYLHNVALGIDLDLEKLFGIPNTTFLVTASQRSGRSLTEDSIGNAISVQQLFGGGQTYRLVQVRVNHSLFDDRLELSYGRLSATSDFMTSPLYCQFVMNGICGQPTAPFFNMPNGLTAYPQATWGALVQYNFTPEVYLKAAVYDGDPDNGDPTHGTNFGWGNNGVLILSEFGYKSKEGLFSMPGRYSIGGFHHTGTFPDVAVEAFNTNFFDIGTFGLEKDGQSGFYFILEQMLHRNRKRPETGLTGFVTFVTSPDQAKSDMPYFLNAGLIYEGILPGRPKDKAALGMYSGWFSRDSRKKIVQRAAGVGTQTAETTFELNYQIQFKPYLYLRPYGQFVMRPNGFANIDPALVLGAELGITF